MALHFSEDEFARRKASVLAKMADRKLDAMLIFSQESMYWLTGYDTFGFSFFQCLILKRNGDATLFARSADLRQAQLTSNIEDIHIWSDRVQRKASPAVQLRKLLENLDMLGCRIGIEYKTHGLTAANGKALDDGLHAFADTQDASDIIPPLRAIKSRAELDYCIRAGELTDLALSETMPLIKAGADEAKILAKLQGVILENGGDYPANDFILGSGEEALLCRYKAGRRVLSENDQLTIEWAGVYRHYHAPAMRTLVVGEPTAQHTKLYEIASEALAGIEAIMKPGTSFGEIFDKHAEIIDSHGANAHRLNACGYGVGASFAPSWMDWPMFYRGNETEICPNMTLFAHMVLMDSDSKTAMCLGQSYITTESEPEPLSKMPMDYLIS